MNQISERDLAWLTGLFEGEGCMSLSAQGRPVVRLGMTDEDVVRRAHAIAGVGYVRPAPSRLPSEKLMWAWGVGRCEEAAELIGLMLPLFGERRSAKAREILASYEVAPPPKRLRTHCFRGHPLSGDNLRIDRPVGKTARRGCRACAVLNQRIYRTRHPEQAAETNRRSKANAKQRRTA